MNAAQTAEICAQCSLRFSSVSSFLMRHAYEFGRALNVDILLAIRICVLMPFTCVRAPLKMQTIIYIL